MATSMGHGGVFSRVSSLDGAISLDSLCLVAIFVVVVVLAVVVVVSLSGVFAAGLANVFSDGFEFLVELILSWSR